MAVHRAHRAEPGYYESSMHEVRTTAPWDVAMRVVGVIAGAVPLVIGLIALARIDWGEGFSAPLVDVAGMMFSPGVAIATAIGGLIAVLAGAATDRASKLVVGVILVCVGIAVVIVGTAADIALEAAHGWMSLIVGAVLAITGMLMSTGYTMTEEDHYVAEDRRDL